MYFLDMLVMDLFPIYLIQNHYFCFYFFTLAFYFVPSGRQFSAHPQSSLACIDKRTAWATRNTRFRYNKIGPLDHKMADNCVSLARTNTVSSTITKLIKSWKTSNKSYTLLNRINKLYTRELFYLQQDWVGIKRGLRLSINRFGQLNHN